jgi:cardiolipin synthase
MNDPRHDTWSRFLGDVEPKHRISVGNRVTHLRDDDRAVRAIWTTIEEADERVWMSMYVLAPDEVGLGTIERLAAAAQRGCDVCVTYDYLGSIRLRDDHLEPLKTAGGGYAPFNRFWPPWKHTGSPRIRDHRKVIIVDTRAALCGGLNLSDEHVSEFGDEWIFDDTVLMIEGPAVRDLMGIFQSTWQEASGRRVELPPGIDPLDGGKQLQVLETDPRRPETRLRQMLEEAVRRARRRCLIAAPYFLPADWLVEALLEAALRGADVRIITAGRTDLPPVRAAARHAFGPLLEAGVRIYEMYGRMLHSKIVTIDGTFGTIGSYNLDRWTAQHALDISIAIVSESIACSLEEECDTYIEASTEFTLGDFRKRGLPTRALHWIASRAVDLV